VNPKTLDHVAFWVADRDTIADFATSYLGMHVIERTDRFTLVGSDARRGKLTFFDAEGPRERGALKHVALRVNDLPEALESPAQRFALGVQWHPEELVGDDRAAFNLFAALVSRARETG